MLYMYIDVTSGLFVFTEVGVYTVEFETTPLYQPPVDGLIREV